MADASEHHRPGELPPVRDEAADSPLWLPVVGLCFLVVGAFAVLWQANATDLAADEAAADEAAAVEPAAE